METQKITLSRSRAQTVLHAVQGEANAQTFAFTLLDSQNSPIQITADMSASFYVDKYDGNPVQIQAQVDAADQTVNVTLPLQATAAAGNHICLLQVYSNSADIWRGDVVLSVIPNPASQIPSRPEFQVLTQLMLNAESTIGAINKASTVLQDLESKLLAGIEEESHTSFNFGNTTLWSAASDGTRWYAVAAYTDVFWYSDDLINWKRGTLATQGIVNAMAASENQVCVIGPEAIQISANWGQTFIFSALPSEFAGIEQFIGLKRYGAGFIAIPDEGSAIYIEYSGGSWRIESMKAIGQIADAVVCGSKLVTAVSGAASTAIRIYDPAGNKSVEIPIPGNRTPRKLGWDGKGVHIICADRSTFYYSDIDSLTTMRQTGKITDSRFASNSLSEVVSIGNQCAVVMHNTNGVLYAGPGQPWSVLDLSQEEAYIVTAAAGGKILAAGNKCQAVLGLQTTGTAYEKRLETLCAQIVALIQEYLVKIKELENSAGRKIVLTKTDPGAGTAAEAGTIVFVYEEG